MSDEGQPSDEVIARYVRDHVELYEVPSSLKLGIRRADRKPHVALGGAIRWTLVVAVAVLVVGAIDFTRVGRGNGGLSGAPSIDRGLGASLNESLAPSHGMQASPSETRQEVDLSDFIWFDVAEFGPCSPELPSGDSVCAEPNPPRVATVTVAAGTLDGNHHQSVSFELRGITTPDALRRAQAVAFSGAPFDVLYTANDVNGGALRSLNVVSGAHDERIRTSALIQTAVFDQRDGSVVASLVSPTDRTDRGIWRIHPSTGTETRIVSARPKVDLESKGQDWRRQLWLTPDSTRIVAFDCVDFACEASVYDANSGSLVAKAAALRDEVVYGATDTALIGVLDCPAQPCRISALDLSNGQLRPLVSWAPCTWAPAALAVPFDRTSMMAVGALPGPACNKSGVEALDTETGTLRTAWTARTGPEAQLQVIERNAIGYTAPPGWIALGPGGGFYPVAGETALPVLLSLLDGSVLSAL